jgi:carbamate kinase
LNSKKRKELLVVALGGNAFLRRGEKRTFQEQNKHIRDASKYLADLIEAGYRLVITHGNGPQIGDTLLRHEAGQKMFNVPALPMDVCVAETQGSIGYMIQQALRSELKRRKLNKVVLSMLTRVIVDKQDRELRRPTKPIGPYYSKSQVKTAKKEHSEYTFAYDKARGGWRRLVVSPNPMRIGIAEQSAIKLLVESGCTVIACGGGGIPVIENKGWQAVGIEAVVDKDLAGERLASLIRADRLVILTDIDAAYLNFGKPKQKKLRAISVDEAREYLNQGQFLEGSMEPKILAGIRFVENQGKSAIICDLSKVTQALEGSSGTTILPEKR